MKNIMTVKTLMLVAGLLFGTSVAQAVDKHEMQVSKGEGCEVCGMYIEVYRNTACEVVFENGTQEHFCGIACALRDINEHLGMPHVKSAYATDWDTHEAVPLEQAVLVVDSDLTPDMIPNYIAFRSETAAHAFQEKHGGKILSLENALASISYQGMTMPFRITTAATPPARIFSVGTSLSYMYKNKLLTGDSDRSTRDVLKTRSMIGKKMEGTMANLVVGGALTDDLYADLVMPYGWKRMTAEKKNGDIMTFKEDGFGDLALSGRWRFYHDELSDKHLAVVLRTSTPTGEFKNENRARPGMQLGTGAFGFGSGLLYSQHIGLFWLHAGAEYLTNLENSDDYQFGDVARTGVALHFTPSTKTMVGLEIDGVKTMENRSYGSDVPDTGCEGVYVNLVGQRRVATFWGGNFDLRAMVGAPAYENVEGTQLGEAFHAVVGMQWKRRF
ncbi:MAG: nitrous oxide reductase accessory protein NosL [Lentisphaerota bacterium]